MHLYIASQFFQKNSLFTYKLIFYVIVVVCAMFKTVLVVMYELLCCFHLLEMHNIQIKNGHCRAHLKHGSGSAEMELHYTTQEKIMNLQALLCTHANKNGNQIRTTCH